MIDQKNTALNAVYAQHRIIKLGKLDELVKTATAAGHPIDEVIYKLIGGVLPEFPLHDITTITGYWLKGGGMIRKWSASVWYLSLPTMRLIPAAE